MGGEIDILSIVGQGSTFFFYSPLNPADTPILLETDCDSPDRSTHKTHTMTFSGLTALLVEDNKVNQLVANSMLKKIGFEVDIAPSGDAAIEMLSIRAYDVIFMDCQMPGRDGFETTRIIRNSEIQETVIIAMTANTTQQDKDQCFTAGMNGFCQLFLPQVSKYKVLLLFFCSKRIEQIFQPINLYLMHYAQHLAEFAFWKSLIGKPDHIRFR